MIGMLNALRKSLERSPEVAPDSPPVLEHGTYSRLGNHLLAMGLALATFLALFLTPDMGFTRDEGFYFRSGKLYVAWFDELEENIKNDRTGESFTQENIDRHWSDNPEHPVLMKTLFGLSYRSLAREREWLPPSTAMRLPAMIFTAVLVWLLFLFMAEAYSRTAGFFAAVALISMPRLFFHAHLACFDAPMMMLWFAVIYGYWKSLESRPWAYGAGVLFGIALITKLNAFFLPPLLVMHWALHGWRDFWLVQRKDSSAVQLHFPKLPLAFTTMAIIGPVIFYLLWPRHWFDTFSRIQAYFERHLGHEHYPVYYFNEILGQPPFPTEFPFVMTLITVPLITLTAFFIGCLAIAAMTPIRARIYDVWTRLAAIPAGPGLAWLTARLWAIAPSKTAQGETWNARYAHCRPQLDRLRNEAGEPPARRAPRDSRGTTLLMALALLVPILVISRESTPVFGGTKHWMNGMPFLAAFAGIGFAWAFDRSLALIKGLLPVLARPRVRGAILILLTPLLLWPAVRATAHAHPYGTSYYNVAIGSYVGAADARMQRQFWGYAARPALAWLNENAPKGARVHWHNTIYMAYEMYKEDSQWLSKQGEEPLLREDIGIGGMGVSPNADNVRALKNSDYVLFHHQKVFDPFLYELWHTYGTTSPVYVVSIDGVPLVSVYENPRRRGRK